MDDDLTGLDEALRAALGPESPLWNGSADGADASGAPSIGAPSIGAADAPTEPSRDVVVHGVRRRRARRLRAVTALTAVLVVVGLAVSQVLAGTTPVPTRHRAGTHAAANSHARTAASNGPVHERSVAAPAAECRPSGSTTRPCGVLTAAPGPATGTTAAASTAAASTAAASTAAASTRAADSHAAAMVLQLAVGQAAAVTLPSRALWAHPSVAASNPQGTSGTVLTVRAPPATGVSAVHGWVHFSVVGDATGTATVAVTGSCAPSTSCSGGHTLFSLVVEVGGT